MTPTHTTKLGVRYRYYVSHAILQKRRDRAGDVIRVPAPEIEDLVVKSVRENLTSGGENLPELVITDRDLIEAYVERVTVRREAVEVRVFQTRKRPNGTAPSGHAGNPDDAAQPATISLPWAAPTFAAVKGIVHAPSSLPRLTAERQEALLTAIAKAREWVSDLAEGRIASFAAIAESEGKVERHIRLLAPLAFVSPRIVSAIIDGGLPPSVTVTGLANGLPHSWAKQVRPMR